MTTCQTCGWYPLALAPLWKGADLGGFYVGCTGCAQPQSDCYCEDAEGGDD